MTKEAYEQIREGMEEALSVAHGWQPIETAPKDGTLFLTFSREAAHYKKTGALGLQGTPMMVMVWVVDAPSPIDEDGDIHDINCWVPTHWAPLPNPPSEGSE